MKILFIFLSIVCCTNLPAEQNSFKILLFSKTAGYRHQSIPVGVAAIKSLGTKAGFNVIHSEDSSVFNDKNLQQFSGVVFLSTTGDILNDEQQLAFQRFIQAGGGFVGIHAATDTEYKWPWYTRLAGAQFASHPHQQDAVQNKTAEKHQCTDFIPKHWKRFDEWYNFKNFSPRIKVLLTLDEKSYKGGKNGDYHPSSWYQEYDGGRMFYTAGGHTAKSYAEPLFLKHILAGILYTSNNVKLHLNS